MKRATLLASSAVLAVAWAYPTQKAPKVPFASSVGLVIKAHCLNCHQGQKAAAGLDLSDPKLIKAANIVVPGNVEKSELWRRIKGLDGLPAMPLNYKPLSPEKIKLVEDWIKAGASYDGGTLKHWSYLAPKKPVIPAAQNAIDFLVREKLSANKLSPSPKAPKEVLLRRVYLDLIGLPPTVAQMDAFLADQSPKAYEKVVDALLASPQYGERQARIWLDLARYADTNGYEADFSRPSAWVYRDWVINAFNKNMRFDQFTRDQIAGDLLPNATQDQKVATGFHRNSMFNSEGGVDPGESRYLTMVDRVSTTSTVWLGSTLGCARCHDHKFDPFTQKDFTRMYAIFNNTTYTKQGDAKVGQEKWYEPTMKVLSADQKQKLTSLETQLSQCRQTEKTLLSQHQSEYNALMERVGKPASAATLVPTSMTSDNGNELSSTGDGIVTAAGPNPDKDVFHVKLTAPNGAIHGLSLEALGGKDPVGRSGGGNFLLTQIDVWADGKKVDLVHAEADFIQEGYDLDRLLRGDKESGWAVYPRPKQNHKLIVDFGQPIEAKELKVDLRFESVWTNHVLRQFRLAAIQSPTPSVSLIPMKQKESAGRLLPALRPIRKQIEELQMQQATLQNNAPDALVLQEQKTSGAPKAPLYNRGEFLSPGVMVEGGVPNSLPALPAGAQPNRLGLAQWLTAKNNPLTARVQVNRMWEQYFGRGIVDTSEDFGTQASLPTHPKLLDWLACEFMDSGWDMKHMNKLIVMSATYQQSSNVTPQLKEKDPNNLLVARGPRFRMEAEMIRDATLTSAGLINLKKIGGPSVMPYQPDGIWDSPYSGERWMEDKSDARYRRGLYVFWKRASTYPSFMALDATSRETCTARRIRTNTPLQALTLLNDKAYFEAAEALGKIMASKGVAYGFRACTGRKPTAQEQQALAKTLAKFKQRYDQDPASAAKLGGKAAAWTMLGNVLLNLDETITKE